MFKAKEIDGQVLVQDF